MTPEVTLLLGLLKKARYDEYRPFIDETIFTGEEHKRVLELIDAEHKRDKDYEDVQLSNVLALLIPDMDRLPTLEPIVRELGSVPVDDVILDNVFERLKQRNLANQIMLKALAVSEGREQFDDLVAFVDTNKSTKVASVDDVNILSMRITEYAAEEETDGGLLRWRLGWLNKALGPLRRGNLGHLFANPEVGKTAFWISEVTHMVSQTNRPIVIFFNEEDGKEVVYRMYSSMLGTPYQSIIENPAKFQEAFLSLGGDRIIFVDEAPLRMGKMERVMAKYQPAFVVIDNADKIATKSAERRDLEIHQIYKWARELAKEYCPILTVAHADSSAYGEKYLTEAMMANSKVGKPAEMDFIIGIGKEEGQEVARYLSLPKNKLRGDKDTVAQLRHGRWPVALQAEISRFVDTANEQ